MKSNEKVVNKLRWIYHGALQVSVRLEVGSHIDYGVQSPKPCADLSFFSLDRATIF